MKKKSSNWTRLIETNIEMNLNLTEPNALACFPVSAMLDVSLCRALGLLPLVGVGLRHRCADGERERKKGAGRVRERKKGEGRVRERGGWSREIGRGY